MNEGTFVQQREPDWQRLSILCDKADAGASRLKGEELTEFVRLYRQVTGDLAEVRSQSANLELTAFLNALVGRAYGILYRRPRKDARTVVRESLATGARTMRKRVAFVLASLAIFLTAGFFTAGVMIARPDLARYFVDPEDENLQHWKSGEHAERDVRDSFAATGMYSSNNPRVAMMAGAVAASTFGVGTVVMMWMNGAILGAYSVELAKVGQLGHFYVSIIPHGATELSGAIVAGGSGLILGWALIAPGRRTRGDALREAGKDAFVLLVMSMIMMFLAAPVEGFFSFNPNVPAAAKAAFGVVVFTGWLLYWGGYARDPSAESAESHDASL
ncbi:MAG TPA: stage II sporulation protein M [Fimbriimonadaceae bacterium]|nr:stage II sporulation protein M [Fimbriimonadaceae bacterium]HRJ97614.1 stage II sporulation protein M [Fimbriimonadaceae bacterium]